MILPKIELSGLYNQIDFKKFTWELSSAIVTTVIPVYICPSDGLASKPIFTDRYGPGPTSGDDPNPAMGLWYTASMGPTAVDGPTFNCRLPPRHANFPGR